MLSAAATVVEPFDASMKTLPSAGALATEAAAISPLAPARFSTTTLRPSRSPMPGAISRVNRSFGPPGGKPTTKRSGRSGKSTLLRAGSPKGAAAIPQIIVRRVRLIIGLSMLVMAFVQTAQGALHYEVVEQTAPWQVRGLPILFHHGIGSSSMLWRGWYPALIDRFPLAIFDMRGCGRSHIPDAGFDWSLDLMVEDLFAVADAAGLRRFHLVGESIGGTVALPRRLPGPTARHAHRQQRRPSRRHHRPRPCLEEAARRGRPGRLVESLHARPLPRRCIEPRALGLVRGAAGRVAAHSILEALSVLVGADLTPRLGEIKCPTLLLHPDGSPFIPVRSWPSCIACCRTPS